MSEDYFEVVTPEGHSYRYEKLTLWSIEGYGLPLHNPLLWELAMSLISIETGKTSFLFLSDAVNEMIRFIQAVPDRSKFEKKEEGWKFSNGWKWRLAEKSSCGCS